MVVSISALALWFSVSLNLADADNLGAWIEQAMLDDYGGEVPALAATTTAVSSFVPGGLV